MPVGPVTPSALPGFTKPPSHSPVVPLDLGGRERSAFRTRGLTLGGKWRNGCSNWCNRSAFTPPSPAPAQWFAIEGLRRYGFFEDSTRLAEKFRQTVDTNYLRDGTIREKYNVVDGSANIAVSAGYKTDVIGFEWTNGVYARLAKLVPGSRAQTRELKTIRPRSSPDFQ